MQSKDANESEELALLSVEIGARFLFTTCLHTKESLRGVANDWSEALLGPLKSSKKARNWFAKHVLFDHPQRFCEYLLQCPSAEVRSAFGKILVCLAHMSLTDEPCHLPASASSIVLASEATLADHIFKGVLNLWDEEVEAYGRHLSQYFNLFLVYASLGLNEKNI